MLICYCLQARADLTSFVKGMYKQRGADEVWVLFNTWICEDNFLNIMLKVKYHELGFELLTSLLFCHRPVISHESLNLP